MRPAEPVHGPPHGRHTQLLALVLRPPGTVLLDGRIRLCFQPREEDGLLLVGDLTRAARNGLARERARLALLHHSIFDRVHGHLKTASGFSHGQTVSHRSHQAFFEIGRIGTHGGGHCTTHACQ